jgi:germination protein YpeB
MSLKTKVIDWKNRLKDRHMFSIIVALILLCIVLGGIIYKKQREYRQVMENQYNLAFFELVNYVQNVENYLAKATISSTPEHGAETLTRVWEEANLAQMYLAQLPINNEGLSNTARFLNQVSDYSYSLSRKNIYNESLSQEDLDNLNELHEYCVGLQNTLNQLSAEMLDGTLSWKELTKKGGTAFSQQVSNMTQDSFSNMDSNFGEYEGLIYDGAYSEHIDTAEKKGLTGEDIDEETAKQKAIDFVGNDRISNISSNGLIEHGDIPSYSFSIDVNGGDKNNPLSISITKKGGHVLFMNYNRNIEAEVISNEDANQIGLDFLANKGFDSMKETYFLKQDGIITINYAYYQDNVTVYTDLVKLKIALDNGEILGIETKGYLNSHTVRDLETPKITIEEAKANLNKNLEILDEGLAIIPTEWKTEIECYEFKGKVNDKEFLVYINSETGREENILVIINTPNGTLTM